MTYVLNKSIKTGLSKKFCPNYKGSYKITKINDNNTVELEIRPSKRMTYHTNLLKPFFSDGKSND